MKNKYLYSILFIFAFIEIQAQNLIPLNKHWIRKTERMILQNKNSIHTAIKPFIISDTSKIFNDIYTRKGEPTHWIERKLRYENLLFKDEKNFRITADILFHLEALKNKSIDDLFYRNTRGLYVTGRIGKNVSFYSMLHENQIAYQPYINKFIEDRDVIPFGANYKPYEAPKGLAKQGYDYSLVEGVVSWNALPQLNLQIGQARHFVGEGYRSLLLSDNSYSYPFVKATINLSFIQYSSMFAEMMNFDKPNSAESGYHKKRFSMHYLSFRINKAIQIGLFESVVYNPEDSIGYNGFKPNYINPIILSRTIEYGLNGKNNVMLGLVWKANLTPNLQQYGQIVWDEFGKYAQKNINSIDNKTGFQVGIKWFDAFTISNLYLQSEYNRVRPFTNSSKKVSQGFIHARQSIVHPKNANFHELIGILSYRLNDFEIELQGNILQYGLDSTLKANNITLTQINTEKYTTQATFLQGQKINLTYNQAQLSYLLNPATDLRIYAAIGYRQEWFSDDKDSDLFFSFGLRTFLTNNLFDF